MVTMQQKAPDNYDPKDLLLTDETVHRIVKEVAEKSTNDCLNVCKNSTGCNWFSYDASNGFCGLFVNCPTLDTDMEQCLSGKNSSSH